jgi:hypothetical protein
MKAGMFRTSSVLSNSELSLSSEIFIPEYSSTLSETRQQERASGKAECENLGTGFGVQDKGVLTPQVKEDSIES